ncbi:hypothetical protein JMUB6875_13800 [Nocardia sp. JMUB6875]
MQRVRVVTEPHTDYIRFAIAITAGNVAAGEDIRWLPREHAPDSLPVITRESATSCGPPPSGMTTTRTRNQAAGWEAERLTKTVTVKRTTPRTARPAPTAAGAV